MNSIARRIVQRARMRSCRGGTNGFSLIELMIAMLLGLMLSEGIYVLLSTSSRANATQLALARLQDSGRVALETIASDLRSAGHMPCGAQSQPQVFSDALATHVIGAPTSAAPPPGAVDGEPYRLDRGLFLSGSSCTAKNCAPALATALGVPRTGTAVGDKIPGSDVLTIRYLQGDGLPATLTATSGNCSATDPIAAVLASNALAAGFASGHLAMLTSCTSAQIFAVAPVAGGVQPIGGRFGLPKCSEAGSQPRLFDFDATLQTSTYYLQLVQDGALGQHRIAALMRRTNGVVNEVVQGVERLDLRYSLRDKDGNAHWLLASQLDRGMSASGAPLQCGVDAVIRACSWADVEAVDVALLVNTVDDLPLEAASSAWSYRYSIDGDNMQTPKAAMPATGLPSGRMLRREFRMIFALRSMTA